MSKKNDERKSIVVVGGGPAGSLLARALSAKLDASKHDLILINDRPFSIHLVAGARMTVTEVDHLEDAALLPYDKLFHNGNGRFVQGRVTAIEEEAAGQGGVVVLQDGERLSYDVLVLATGSSWYGPLNFPSSDADVRAHVKTWRQHYADAKDIVIVGGGAVGIETAGEIRDTYPTKKITIVQGSDLLLNPVYPPKFRKDLEKRVRAKNIDIVFDEYIDSIPEPGTIGVTTRSGKSFATADLVVPAHGPRPNTAFIATLGSDVLDSAGRVKIEPTFQVVGHPGVFAFGDITDWKEQKQQGKIMFHLPVAVPNILSYLAGEPLKKKYKGFWEMIIIPIGKNGGGGYFDVLWGIVVGNWVTRVAKAKDLFIPKVRAEFGLQ
ncbi:FAD/NAD(P)-binding domain-containing protein [Obba rivulosa]|uniref:FAD/NAD(P)-binding domain-containing protein n=1 Tax=Obba rivulosa TaxID=1052685 RepID=A0A8E2B561_9APHY|nr:FAD/NAD(P)-binding domain-containing protein [Obba rivulosa]